MYLPQDRLNAARSLFPYLSRGKLYLNHAGTSPLSTRVVEAMSAYLHRRSEGELDTYPEDRKMVDECRSFVTRLIHAEGAERIAFQFNTSDAINVVASGIPWKSGDSVLLGAIEFPANVYPYINLRAQGVTLDFITSQDGRVTADMIAARLHEKTRLVALSAVQFLSGYRADLRAIGELCRNRGIVFAVDAIQAVGAVHIDVQQMQIDFLAAGAQKWQMSPHGSGFLYITEELQSRLHQKYLGWLAVAHPWNFYDVDQPLADTARRYEGGSLNMPSLWGMHAALATILEYGPAPIESHLLAITGHLMERLRQIRGLTLFTPTADGERAGIVTVSVAPPLNPQKVFERLTERGLTIAIREGKLRYSPHFYNTKEDMDRVADLTGEAMKEA